MTRGRTLVRPEWTTLPPGDITAGEWTAARSDITIISKRRYDIERFGDIGTADDGPTWAAAYAQVEAWGGGTIASPAGDFLFKTGFEVKNGVYTEFQGMGNTHLDFSGLTTPVGPSLNTAIYGAGALVALPALGANVTLHTRTVTFAAAPALTPGDVFLIYDSTNKSFSTADDVYRAGEYCRVDSISGSTVTVSSPMYAAYTAAANIQVYRLDAINTGLAGATMTFKAGYSGITTTLGKQLKFEDLDLSGANYTNLQIDRCYDINIDDVRIFDANPANGYNYGITLGNSQRIRIRDCDVETRRHGLNTGGTGLVGCVPVRDLVVTGGRISSMGTGGLMGVGLHGNAEDVHFTGVKLPNGFLMNGKSGSVRGCTIWSDAVGIAILTSELLSPDWTIESNLIKATANHATSHGLVYVLLDAVSTVGYGSLVITDNTFDLGPYNWTTGAGTYVVRVHKTSASAASTNTLTYSNNRIRTQKATIGAADYMLRLQSSLTDFGFSHVNVHNNDNPYGLSVFQEAAPTPALHFVGAGTGAPAFRARIGSQYMRMDAGGASTMYVNTDGTGAGWKTVTTAA